MAQKRGLELGLGAGYMFIMPNYNQWDAVDKLKYIDMQSRYGSGEIYGTRGYNVLNLEGHLLYRFSKRSAIGFGYDQRFRPWVINDNVITTFNKISDDFIEINIAAGRKVGTKPGWIAGEQFIIRSTNYPIYYKHSFKLDKAQKHTLSLGLGFSYYASIRNQFIRRTTTRRGKTYGSYPLASDSIYFRKEFRINFETDDYHFANGVLKPYYMAGYDYKLKNGSRLEFVAEFFDNFGVRFEEYIKIDWTADVVKENPGGTYTTLEPLDRGTERFYLQQGGLRLGLRFYPNNIVLNRNVN